MKTFFIDWNLIPYAEAWQRQTEWFDNIVRAKVQGESYENRIVMCEHPHVYTLGRSGKENNMLLSDEQLKAIDATLYHKFPGENSSSNRKKEICRELIQAITENYKNERRAQFYADKLGISLQHLSTTVRQVTGKSVLDTIAYIVIMDAKAKLKGTNMTIQEIAYSLNFPSASFFGKYFRRYVGMTPLDFRNR